MGDAALEISTLEPAKIVLEVAFIPHWKWLAFGFQSLGPRFQFVYALLQQPFGGAWV